MDYFSGTNITGAYNFKDKNDNIIKSQRQT